MRRSTGEWIFAKANFEGLSEVNREICLTQMAEKTMPDAPPNGAAPPYFSSQRMIFPASRVRFRSMSRWLDEPRNWSDRLRSSST